MGSLAHDNQPNSVQTRIAAPMTTHHEKQVQSLTAATRESPCVLNEAARGKALAIARWLEEKKAKDIVVLDVTPFSAVADVMVICTAQSARHAQALADWILERFAEQGIAYLGMEGYVEGRWVLVDGNDVLVHILQEESREFYNLDGLWARGNNLLAKPDAPHLKSPSDQP